MIVVESTDQWKEHINSGKVVSTARGSKRASRGWGDREAPADIGGEGNGDLVFGGWSGWEERYLCVVLGTVWGCLCGFNRLLNV